MSFADNLQSIRKEKKLSQEELAERIGVSRQAVSKWEQGSGYPETEKLLVLSKELNVSLDYLMLGETAHVMNVYVKEGYRKKGIALNMMKAIIKDAIEKGITHISLDATEQGRPLYEKIGFKPTDEGMEMILNQ